MCFKFNVWKHHLAESLAQLDKCNKKNLTGFFPSVLLSLGNNVVDVYVGKLDEETIKREVGAYLQKKQCFEYDAFIRWISNAAYRKITLSDNSVWIIRLGFQKDQYIHIHPAKHSPHTVRTNSNTLKTIYYLYVHKNLNNISRELINKIRKEKLNLPPVKTLDEMKKCRTMIEIVKKRLCHEPVPEKTTG